MLKKKVIEMKTKKQKIMSQNSEVKKETPSPDEVMARLLSTVNNMQKVDINAPDAKANEASMDDNNGGRIIYFVVKGNKYQFVGNKKKTLELLKLLEGSLVLVSWKDEAKKNRKRSK